MKFLQAWVIPSLVSIFVTGAIIAGTNTLPTETASVISRSHVNKFQTALAGDIVPRNSSGVATTGGGSLGSTTYKFLKLFVLSGGWSIGDIKAHHSYNGTAAIGHGWMKADGRVINEANYDVEHGAGTWDTYIGSSALDGKFLPNLTGKYLVGISTTSQTGSVAITGVGNTNHQINIEHTHTIADHSHTIAHTHTLPAGVAIAAAGGAGDLSNTTGAASNANSGNASLSPANSLSSTQSIQPESIEVQYYMRIIE